MTIHIGENIKKLRLEKELTQEALADFLGVTFQSISRWERGESYPDITMLPCVAAFFGVSVDSLLGVSEASNEEKIREYLDIYDNMKLKDSTLAFKKYEAAVKEFPGDYRILIRYMELLQEEKLFNNSTDMSRSGACKKASEKISKIYESIQKHCTDDSIRIRSKRVMISHLLWMHDCERDEKGDFIFNKEHLDRAKKIAESLPSICDSREMVTITNRENYYETHKKALEELIFLLHEELLGYCLNRDASDKIKQYEALQNLLELIYPDNDYGKNCFNRLYNYGHLGHLYHQVGDDENALRLLKTAAEYAKELDNAPDGSERAKRFYNYGTAYRELSACEFMKTVMTEHYPLSEEFKSTKEFKEIIETLG